MALSVWFTAHSFRFNSSVDDIVDLSVASTSSTPARGFPSPPSAGILSIVKKNANKKPKHLTDCFMCRSFEQMLGGYGTLEPYYLASIPQCDSGSRAEEFCRLFADDLPPGFDTNAGVQNSESPIRAKLPPTITTEHINVLIGWRN